MCILPKAELEIVHVYSADFFFYANVQGIAMKFPEWFYCKHTCIPIAHWEGSPLK